MTVKIDHPLKVIRPWRPALGLALLMSAAGLLAACVTDKTRPVAQEISAAVERPDAGVTTGPTGVPYGVAEGGGLDDQERRRLLEAARVAFVSTTGETTAYTIVPQNIDAEPTSVTARAGGPLETRPGGGTCRPIELSVTKRGRTTMGALTFCRAPGSNDIRVSRAI